MAMYPTTCTECYKTVMSSALDDEDFLCWDCENPENSTKSKLLELDDLVCDCIMDYNVDTIRRESLRRDLHRILEALREIHGSL